MNETPRLARRGLSLSSGIAAGWAFALLSLLPNKSQAQFSGDFSQPGGAVYDGGDADQVNKLVYDSSGPWLYAVGSSSLGARGWDWVVVKYDMRGVKLASATLDSGGDDFAWDAALDGSGRLCVIGQSVPGSSRIVRYSSDLSFLSSASVSGSGMGIAFGRDSGLDYLWALTFDMAFLKAVRFGGDLVQGPSADVAHASVFTGASPRAAVQSGSPAYLFIETGFGIGGSAETAMYNFTTYKYDGGSMLMLSSTAFSPGENNKSVDIAINGSNVFVVGMSTAGGVRSGVVARYDRDLVLLSSASAGSGGGGLEGFGAVAVDTNTGGVVAAGPDGTYRLGPSLALISSNSFGGYGAAVQNSSAVYVGGGNGDFITRRLDMAAGSGGGTQPATPGYPAGDVFSGVSSFTMAVAWSSGTSGGGYNAPGTLYQVEVSTLAGFGGLWASSSTVGLVQSFLTLADNSTFYARVRVNDGAGSTSAYLVLGATITRAAAPAGVFFDEISSASITASAYAPSPSFMNLGRGMSATALAKAGSWSAWQASTWTSKADMPTARRLLAAAAVGGKIYALGGYNGSSLHANEEYDPVTNAWTSKAAMTTGRSDLAAAVSGGRIYALGGIEGINYLSTNEEYDPAANAWTAKAGMPTGRSDVAAAVLNGKIYALGGYNGSDLSKNEEYDPSANSWTGKADMPTARDCHAAAAVGGKIYALGGYAGSGYLAVNEEYDAGANAWTSRAAMPTARFILAAAAVGGKIYALGGSNGSRSAANEEYDPGSNRWTSRASMPAARDGLAAAAAGGRIYALGGYGAAYLSANEEFDPGVASKFDGLAPNALYSFKAKARNSLGVETSESPVASTYTLAVAAPPQNGPVFQGVFASSLSVNWSSGTADGGFNGPGATFLVEASTDIRFVPVAASSRTANYSAAMSGLVSDRTYYFRVKAYNAAGVSGESFLPLGSTRTANAAGAGTFSGDFSSDGGAAYGGGGSNWGVAVAVDTFSASGPFVYSLIKALAYGATTSILVKYGPAGVKLSSVAFSGQVGMGLAVNPNGVYATLQSPGEGGWRTYRLGLDLGLLSTALFTGAAGAGNTALTLDRSGNVFVAGVKQSAFKEFGVVKYDANLTYVASCSFYDTGADDYPFSIKADSSGGVFVAGASLFAGATRYLLVKYDNNLLNPISRTFNDYPVDFAPDHSWVGLAVNPADGNAYLVGTKGSYPGDRDVLTIRYDSNLVQVTTAIFTSGLQGISAAWGRDGYLFVGGSSYGTGDDLLVLKYSGALALQSTAAYSSSDSDEPGLIDVDNGGKVYMAASSFPGEDVGSSVARTLRFDLGASTGTPESGFAFSGSFASTAGAVVSADSGFHAAGARVLVDTISANGPFIHSMFLSSSNAAAGDGWSVHLVKYDKFGVFVASSYATYDSEWGLGSVLDDEGNLYINDRQGSNILLRSWTKDLAPRSSAVVGTAPIGPGGIHHMASDGRFIFAGSDQSPFGVMKFDKGLNLVAQKPVMVSTFHAVLGMAIDGAGSLDFLYRHGSSLLLKRFDSGLTALQAERDVTSDFPAGPDHSGFALAASGPNVYAAGSNLDGSMITLRRYGPDLFPVGDKSVLASSSPWGSRIDLKRGFDGDIYLAAGSTVGGVSKGLAVRFDLGLNVVSSAAFGGAGPDQAFGIGVVDSSSVFVAGTQFYAGKAKAFTRKLNLTGAAPRTDPFIGLAFDSQRNLWAGLEKTGEIRKYPGPIATPITASMPPASAIPGVPNVHGLALDSGGNLWAGVDNNRLYRFAKSAPGQFVSTPSAALAANLDAAASLAFQPGTGDMFVANWGGNSPSGSPVVRFLRGGSQAEPVFSDANSEVYVSGSVMLGAFGIAFDGAGNMWVSSPSSGTIASFSNTGGVISKSAGVVLRGPAKPGALAFDASGSLFVSDTDILGKAGSGRLWRFRNLGTAASPSLASSPEVVQDGVDLYCLAFDADALYGSDRGGNSVVRLSTGIVHLKEYGNIAGTGEYFQARAGTFTVYASTTWPIESFGSGFTSLATGTFSLGGLLAPNTYFVLGFLDSNGNGRPDGFEPRGALSGVFVTADSTSSGNLLLLQDMAAFQGTVVNNSQQSGLLRVEAWQGAPDDFQPFRIRGRAMLNAVPAHFALYLATTTSAYLRAFVDSNGDGLHEAGEDAATVGPLSNTVIGSTASGIGIVISTSAGGTVAASSFNMAPAFLPVNAYDQPMLRLGLRTVGGNAQMTALRVGLLGDAPSANVSARVYKDMNGDGWLQTGTDLFLGQGSFGAGLPPMAQVGFSTQTLTPSTATYFVAISFSGVPAGRKAGVTLNREGFGLTLGSMSVDVPYPLQSGLSPVQLAMYASPVEGGYPPPCPNPAPCGGFDTGFNLQAGQSVSVSASGNWSSGGGMHDANGLSSPTAFGFDLGALVGRIGAGQWFLVGVSTDIAASQPGNLYLAMSDDDFTNNRGLLAVAVGRSTSSATRLWSGSSGVNLNASLGSNWQGGNKPLPGDTAVFDGPNPCVWDLFGAELGSIRISTSYAGTLTVGGQPGFLSLRVSSDVAVGGGGLSLGRNSELQIGGRLVLDGGSLEMSGMSNLRLGKDGALLRGSATFRTVGTETSVVRSINDFERFPFLVESGTVDFRNTGGTRFEMLSTMDLGGRAVLSSIRDLAFRDFNTHPGAVITLRTQSSFDFYNLDFGEGIFRNIDATDASTGTLVTVHDGSGPRFGSLYEIDPGAVVSWKPDGGGSGAVSGTVDFPGGSGAVTVWASTAARFDPFLPPFGSAVLSNPGAYSLPSLPAPNTFYLFAWSGSGTPHGSAARGGYAWPGVLRSSSVFLQNGQSLSSIDVSLSTWGVVSGFVYRETSQVGPIRVQAWTGPPQGVDSYLESEDVITSGMGYSLGAPGGPRAMLAFVDVNKNARADEFEAQSTATALVPGVQDFHLAGGSAESGGTVYLTPEVIHPGTIASSDLQALLRLNLVSSGGDAVLSGLRFDLLKTLPGQNYFVKLCRGLGEASCLGSALVDGTGGASSGTLSLFAPEVLAGGATQSYLLSVDLRGWRLPETGLSLGATYFTLSKGSMAPQGIYPVGSGLARVWFSVPAHTPLNGAGVNTGGNMVGAWIDAGMTVVVDATGTWSHGTGVCSSWGVPGTENRATVVPVARLGELMARVGNSNWVEIGTGSIFTASVGGNLFLGMNDYPGEYFDNSGRVFADYRLLGSTTGAIAGTVFRPGSASGILEVRAVGDGIPVQVSSFMALSASNPYSFSGLTPGRYHVEGFVNGVMTGRMPETPSRSLFVSAGSTVTADFQVGLGTGSIQGTLSYSGLQPYGDFLVMVATVSDWRRDVNFFGSARFPSPGPFWIGGLPAPATYYLAAFRDSNYDGRPDEAEAIGLFGSQGPFNRLSELFTPIPLSSSSMIGTVALFDRGAISGRLTLQSAATGQLMVVAGRGAGMIKSTPSWENVRFVSPGTYLVDLLRPATDYSVVAFVDNDGDGRLSPGDPFGQSPGLLSVSSASFASADLAVQAAGKPGVPSNFSGSAISESAVRWTWDFVPGASGYELLASTEWVVAAVGDANSYAQALAPNEVSAIVRVRAKSGDPSAAVSPVASLACDPAGLSVPSVTAKSAALSWGSNGNSPQTRYEIGRASAASGPFFAVLATTASSALDAGLAPRTTYYYRVRAVNFNGLFSGASTASVFTPASGNPSVSGSIAYGGFQSGSLIAQAFADAAFSSRAIAVSTLPVASLQKYYMEVPNGSTCYMRAFVDVNGNFALDAGEDRGAGPAVAVSSPNANIDWTVAFDTVAPASPAGLSASAVSSRVDVSWTAPTFNADGSALADLAGYRVERSTASGSAFSVISTACVFGASAAVAGASFTDYFPIPGVSNFYRVCALDYGKNQSLRSGVVSARPSAGGTVSGQWFDLGSSSQGVVRIRLSTSPWAGDPFRFESSLKQFRFAGLQPGTYYLRGFRDLNSDGVQEPLSDPTGTYGGLAAPFMIRVYGDNNVTGADVNLCSRTRMTPNSESSAVLSASGCQALDQGQGFFTAVHAFKVGAEAGSVSPNSEVEIRMNSAFPNQLHLLGPDGNAVAWDNSPGGAVIRRVLSVPGVYSIEPTSFLEQVTGPFTLSLKVMGGFSGRISGTVSVTSSRPGDLFVQLFNSPDTNAFPVNMAGLGSSPYLYQFQNLPDGRYFVRAFKDANGNKVKDLGEPWGVYGIGESSPTALDVYAGASYAADFSVADPATGTVAGQILREGATPGAIRSEIGSCKSLDCHDVDVVAFSTQAAAGSYRLDFIPPSTGYLLRAFVDVNGNGRPDPLEPQASSSPVRVSGGQVTTVSLLVRDPGTGNAGDSTVVGTATYSGSQSGPVMIGFSLDSKFEYMPYILSLSTVGAFTKSGLLGDTTYYMAGFIDVNRNGQPDDRDGEPVSMLGGMNTPAPLFVPRSSVVSIATIPALAFSDPPGGSIVGRVQYSTWSAFGSTIVVQAWIPGSQGGNNLYGIARLARRDGVGAYSYRIPFLAAATNYAVNAFVDSNGNERPDFGEPFGMYGQSSCSGQGPCYGTPVPVSSGTNAFPSAGVDISLFNPMSGGPTVTSDNRTLDGNLTYFGMRPGRALARIFGNASFAGVPRFTAEAFFNAGNAVFHKELLPEGTYYADAFIDSNADGSYQPAFEAYGRLEQGGPVVLSGSVYQRTLYGSLRDPGAGGSVNSFFGDFSRPGGARFDGGGSDVAGFVALDAASLSIYAAGVSEQEYADEGWVARYSSSGVKLAHLRGLGSNLQDLAVAPGGGVFLLGCRGRDWACRYGADLTLAASTQVSGSFTSMAFHPGGDVYLAWSDNATSAHIRRLDSGLASVKASYDINLTPSAGITSVDGLAVRPGARVVAEISRGALRQLVEFDENLGLLNRQDVSSILTLSGGGGSVNLALDPTGDLYLGYVDQTPGMALGRIYRFNSSFALQASTSVANLIPRFSSRRNIAVGPEGHLYACWEKGERGGDYLVQRLDPHLRVLAESVYDGGQVPPGEDAAAGLAVLDSSGVFVTGAASNGRNLDWATLRFNLNASTDTSSGGGAAVVASSDVISGRLRYAGTQASSGTFRVSLFPLNGASPIRTSTAAFGAGAAFQMMNVPPGGYQLRAFIDRNGNFILDPDEPAGFSPSDGFPYSGGAASRDLSLCDRTSLAVGTAVAGSFAPSDCALSDRGDAFGKIFLFSGQRGQSVTVELTATGFYDSFLNLYGPDGSRLASDDDGAGIGNARITNFGLPQDGHYMIGASPYKSGVTGSFRLALTGSMGGGALGSISGNVSYDGTQGGRLVAALGVSTATGLIYNIATARLPGPGPYSFANLQAGTSYYLSAFCDSNMNGRWDEGEDRGNFSSWAPVFLRPGQGSTGVDFFVERSTGAAGAAGITGTVAYDGVRQGDLRIEFWSDPKFLGRPVSVRTIPAQAGPFQAPFDISLPGGMAYFLKAYLDIDGDYMPAPEEPKGMYSPNNQGALPVYAPAGSVVPNIDFSLQDPNRASGGGGYAGEGWASLSPSSAPAGSRLASATVQFVAGQHGLGILVVSPPPGFICSYASATSNPPVALSLSQVPGQPAFQVVPGAPLGSGATVHLVFGNVAVPCNLNGDTTFRIGSSSGPIPPQPLLSGQPSLRLLPGVPAYVTVRGGRFGVVKNRISEVQALEARDACGNPAAIADDTVTVAGARFSLGTGRYELDGSLRVSSDAAGEFPVSCPFHFSNQSSRDFFARSVDSGEVVLRILFGPTTYYSAVGVLPGGIDFVSVATVPYLLGRSSAQITPDGDGIADQAFVNFTLPDPRSEWGVMVASAPFKGVDGASVLWYAIGRGQPAKGQIAWDGRYGNGVNWGNRVPSGDYFIRVAAGRGLFDDTLMVSVSAPEISGQVVDAESTPRIPLPDAEVQAWGPGGGFSARTGSLGVFTFGGMAPGRYRVLVKQPSFRTGAAIVTVSTSGRISSAQAEGFDIDCSTTSAGALALAMRRASSLVVVPAIESTATVTGDLWGNLQVASTDYRLMLNCPLHVSSNSAVVDDGGGWDHSVQQFVAKTRIRFDVSPGTYSVRASLRGFDEVVVSSFAVGAGENLLALLPFRPQGRIAGTVSLPAPADGRGVFVSVNAVPASTAAGSGLDESFSGVMIPGGATSGRYEMFGLRPGVYRLLANARGYGAVSAGTWTVPVAGEVNFSTFDNTANVLTGTVTVRASEWGSFLRVNVNAWAPGSMNFGSAGVSLSTNSGGSSSASFRMTGLDPGTTYQVYAWLERDGPGDLDKPGGFPVFVRIDPATHRNPEGSLDFEFLQSSGAIAGTITLPSGATDFLNVKVRVEVLASPRAGDAGRRFEVECSTRDLAMRCTRDLLPPGGGFCPAGNSSATFRVGGLNTETLQTVFTYATSGMARKYQVSVVNGSTTAVSVDLRPDVRVSTFSISGHVLNQVGATTFNTNEKIFFNAASVPLREAGGRAWDIDPSLAARSTDSLARVVAIRRDFGFLNAALSTAADQSVDRVGFLLSSGGFLIQNVPAGYYYLRVPDLRACATCETLVPSQGALVSVVSNLSGVEIPLRDGFTVGGTIRLCEDYACASALLDSRALRLVLRNRRQEVVASTAALIGDAAVGVVASSVAYSFRGLPPGEFFTLTAEDASDAPRYAGPPVKFPDPGLSPNGLESDLSGQDAVLRRAGFIGGTLKDANTGELLRQPLETLLAPNFKITATANPWVEGGYAVAQASVSGRPVRADGSFLAGPLIPDIAYDLRLGQDSWDIAFMVQGSQNYAPVTIAGLKPKPGETLSVGMVGLGQGQSIRGTVVDAASTGTALGNIKVTARPSFGQADLQVRTFTNPAGEYTLWVSTFVSRQYDISFAPPDGNQASNGDRYREVDVYSRWVSTQPLDIRLGRLLGAVTGQVVLADGGSLGYPFGEQKGYPAAAVFLQPLGAVPKDNPLGDLEVQTDAAGFFEFPGLSTGAYSLRAANLGYALFNATAVVGYGSFCISTSASGSCLSQLSLSRGAMVTGRILKPSGAAPSDSEVGGVAAADRGFGEYLAGTVEADPVAKTVLGYTISGFRPGVVYDIVVLPSAGSEIVSPPEGLGVSFSASEATTTKNINLTYIPSTPDCNADSIAKPVGAGQNFRDYQIKIVCSKPLRNEASSDNDAELILSVAPAPSSGTYWGQDGTGDLRDRGISDNRRQVTAIYRSTVAAESRFSLRFAAHFQSLDPTTGLNYQALRVFDFFKGLDSSHKERLSNMQGGSLKLEPSEGDSYEDRFRVDIPPGALDAGTTGQMSIEVRRGRSLASSGAQYLRTLGAVPPAVALMKPSAYPADMYRAMASTGVPPVSSFYSIFLPLGIRTQLNKPVDITLSYDPLSIPTSGTFEINVWHYKGAGTTCPDGRASWDGYCKEANNRRHDAANNTITVSVDHFSTFIVSASSPVLTVSGYGGEEITVFSFPNPADCIPHTRTLNKDLFNSGSVTFDGIMIHAAIPSSSEVNDLEYKIFDVAGELVRSIPQGPVRGGRHYYTPWDCKNDGGRTVASGVYFGVVKWGGKKKFFKMAVIKGSGL